MSPVALIKTGALVSVFALTSPPVVKPPPVAIRLTPPEPVEVTAAPVVTLAPVTDTFPATVAPPVIAVVPVPITVKLPDGLVVIRPLVVIAPPFISMLPLMVWAAEKLTPAVLPVLPTSKPLRLLVMNRAANACAVEKLSDLL